VPALIIDQLRKSVFGLLAYLLVSKISTMPNRPTVKTRRSVVRVPANW